MKSEAYKHLLNRSIERAAAKKYTTTYEFIENDMVPILEPFFLDLSKSYSIKINKFDDKYSKVILSWERINDV